MASKTFTLVEDLVGLNALRDEWNRLAGRFRNPLLCHEWFFSAACAFCPPDTLSVLALRSNGRITGVAPLIRTNRLGIEHYEILGASQLLEPANFLYEDSESLGALVDAALDLGKPLVLGKLCLDSMDNLLLTAQCRKRSFVTIEHTSHSPWIPIDATWAEFEAGMSSSRRSSMRRCRRRLDGEGSVAVELVTRDLPNREEAFEEAIRVEAQGWKGKEGTAILTNDPLRAFFRTYVTMAVEKDTFRLFLLRVDGKAVAMLMGIEDAGRFWVLKIGYDEAWRHCSPGIVLMHETIRWAFEKRLEAYEFLGSNEEWITMWTERTHSYVTHRLYPRSLKGIMMLGIEGNLALLKKATNYKGRKQQWHGYPSRTNV